MIMGVKKQLNCSFYFFYKKHYCADCNGLLERKKREKIVNSHSAEAKNYDFSMPGGDTFLVGDVKFVTYFFECSNCGRKYEISELKRIEKNLRKLKRMNKD